MHLLHQSSGHASFPVSTVGLEEAADLIWVQTDAEKKYTVHTENSGPKNEEETTEVAGSAVGHELQISF